MEILAFYEYWGRWTFGVLFVILVTKNYKEFKYSLPIPRYLAAEVPFVPESVAASTLNFSEIKREKLRCRNNITGCVRKLPVGIAFGENPTDLVETLKFITRERIIAKSSYEPEMGRWVMGTAMGWFTEPINRLVAKQFHDFCITISNIPGPNHITVLEGSPLQDIIAFPVHRNNSGLGAAILSYNQRIQLSLVVDKALISETAHVQEILDRVFNYIDLLGKAA